MKMMFIFAPWKIGNGQEGRKKFMHAEKQRERQRKKTWNCFLLFFFLNDYQTVKREHHRRLNCFFPFFFTHTLIVVGDFSFDNFFLFNLKMFVSIAVKENCCCCCSKRTIRLRKYSWRRWSRFSIFSTPPLIFILNAV